MTGAADRKLGSYSKGMRQRVGLAQSLIGDPAVLILDEPMSGLDPIGRKEVRDLILSLREEGRTVLFSSHILSDAEVICDRVGILVSGRMVHEGSLDEHLGREVTGVELVAEGLNEETVEALRGECTRVTAQGPRFLFEFSDESTAAKGLDRVRNAGGLVRRFAPRRKSLEDLMVELSGGEARS